MFFMCPATFFRNCLFLPILRRNYAHRFEAFVLAVGKGRGPWTAGPRYLLLARWIPALGLITFAAWNIALGQGQRVVTPEAIVDIRSLGQFSAG